MTFASPSERRIARGVHLQQLPAVSALASLEFRSSCVNSMPLIRSTRVSLSRLTVASQASYAQTPDDVAATFGRRIPLRQSRSVRVVSHHLDGFLRTGVAGLLHPATGRGSPRLQSSAPTCRAAPVNRCSLACGGSDASSRRTSHPSKKSPHLQLAAVPKLRCFGPTSPPALASAPLDLRAARCPKTVACSTTLDLEALLRW
jgi:hypothetical protein